ncbi:hypothetical protein ARSEF4850_009994 [Beauveria asiatica]
MTLNIPRVLADVSVRATLQRLDYLDDSHAEELLTDLHTFLKAYVTGDEENRTEPCSEYEDEKSLADIATAWLDDEERGRFYWPCRGPSECPGQLRYDDQDHYFKRYAAIAQATLISARKHEGVASTRFER